MSIRNTSNIKDVSAPSPGSATSRTSDLSESLVHEYTESLLKGALGLGFSIDDARDLVQSVWATFFEIQSKFEGRSHIRTFLFGILYNKAKERRREDKRLVPDEKIDELVDSHFDERGRWRSPPLDPERFLQATQAMKLIEECLDGLPLTQRMAFCLREIDDHGTPDICKILNISVTNLGVVLFRAKARLRECIEHKAKGREGL